MLHAFVVSNLCFACFASQTPGLCSAIPSAPIKFVARLCLILLYSAIIFCVLCLTNIGFVQCFSFRSRKVRYLLLLRFRQNFVLRVLPPKHRVCAVLLPRLPSSLLHRLVFILLYSVISCFACFSSPTSGLCSTFPFGSPQVYYLWFSLFY